MKKIKATLLIIAWSCIAAFQAFSGEPITLADPTIFFDNGTYYLYGTGANSNEGFQVYTSTDLQHWNGPTGATDGYVLKKGNSFGTWGFWAPQVFKHDGKYYMAYTSNEQISIAESNSPMGPFRQTNIMHIPAKMREIDPFVFSDSDGKTYLYHVRLQKGNRLFVTTLSDDMQTPDESTATACIAAEPGWEDTQRVKWTVTEGPTVMKIGNFYYMFYSANDFRNPDYAVGYAVSKSPFGPWKKHKTNPILNRKTIGWNGTGHGDVFTDKNGNLWYVFHVHNSNTKVAPRLTAIIGLSQTEGTDGEVEFHVNPASFRILEQSASSTNSK